MRLERVTLAPLFPRYIAAYIGAIVAIVAWGLPLMFPAASRDGRLACFSFGLLVLTVLFVPRYGKVTVDVDARTLTFREGITARSLHPWRGRESRTLMLREGSCVTIGYWLDKNGFQSGGVTVTDLDEHTSVLFENKFGFDGSIAYRLAVALRRVPGVRIRTVRLNTTFETVEWAPTPSTVGANNALLFFLSWVGFPIAMLGAPVGMLIAAGATCFVLYAATAYVIAIRARKKVDAADATNTTVWYGFALFQFFLTYAVMAVLGRSMMR